MTRSEEKLARVEGLLLLEYKSLCKRLDELFDSSDNNALYDWIIARGEVLAISRVMAYMGIEKPFKHQSDSDSAIQHETFNC